MIKVLPSHLAKRHVYFLFGILLLVVYYLGLAIFSDRLAP